MENNYHNPDNIEAYLSGKLSPIDKVGFENELAKDPLLQSELDLQKDIIESLKANRVIALKQRLNNVEVGGVANPYSSMVFKVAASIIIPSIIGLGVYNFIKTGTDRKYKPNIEEIDKVSEVKKSDKKDYNSVNPDMTKSSAEESLAITNTQDKAIEASGKAPFTKKSIKNKSSVLREPKLKEFSDPEFQGDVNIHVPHGEVISDRDNISDLKVTVEPFGDKTFHYKFYNNKLFLYCDFQSKPYEILELNSSRKRRFYLFYDEAFYELKHTKKDFTPLTELKDQQLIKQLKTIKDK